MSGFDRLLWTTMLYWRTSAGVAPEQTSKADATDGSGT
jgi:hypothetical protein